MTPERFERVGTAFAEIVALPERDRGRALADLARQEPEIAAEVALLLAVDAEASPVLEATIAAGARLLAAGPDAGRVVAGYRLDRELGRGGTSTVYLARRVDDPLGVGPEVAIKVLDRRADGAAVLRRFDNERSILAALDHPGIARLLDVGLTDDGRPFVVLERVAGLPIDEHCRGRSLDLAARVRLMIEVCAIVHAAHQRLVVHRDLKPGNILVGDDGAPKLLDFGIARLLDQGATERTATELVQLTPAYASPEQLARAPVSTATDVWSLGVLFAELATGRRPFRTEGLAPLDVERVVREEPPTFSGDRLPPDLERILRMALRKEPGRRYASVAQFGEDLGRFLEGRPVIARPDTWAYRTATFVRRHRIAVAAAAAFVAVLIAFAVSTKIQSARLARERDRAERVSNLLVELFEVSDPNEQRGSSVTAREILDRGAARLAAELRSEPETRADLQETMGRVYQNLGLFKSAAPLLEQSLATRRRLYPGDHEKLADGVNRLAVVRALAGEYARAEPLFREALTMRERLYGEGHPKVVSSVNNLALVLSDLGDYAAAEPLFRRALDLDARLPLAERDYVPAMNLGLLLVDRGDGAAAEALLRPAVAQAAATRGAANPATARALGVLGLALQRQGKLAAAEEIFRRALAIDTAARPSDQLGVARDLDLLGGLLLARHDLAGAEPSLGRAAAIREELLVASHPELAATREKLARLFLERGELERGDELARRALAAYRASLPAGHPSTAEALVTLALIRIARGGCDEGLALAREAAAIRTARLFATDPRTIEAHAAVEAARRCLAGPETASAGGGRPRSGG